MRNVVPIIMAVVFMAFSMLSPDIGSAAGSNDLLKDIQARYKNLQTLAADYTRVTTTPSMEGVFQSSAQQTASGVLSFKKSAMLLLDQSSPRPEKLITDGRNVWWYIPEEKVVHRYANVDVYGEMKPLLDFLNGLGSLEGSFAVKITPAGADGNPNIQLDLTRLKQGSGPSDITVWVTPDDYTLVGFKLVSLTGESTVFNLKNVRTDVEMNNSMFEFIVPPDVQVIEEAGRK